MKIAVIGCGATGSVFASYLKIGGADLYLIDKYAAHMNKIAADGMRFYEAHTDTEHLIKGFHTAQSAEDFGEMDIVLIMVKTTNTEDAVRSASKLLGDSTVLLSLQNGLGNDEILSQFAPRERIMCGFGVYGTELPEPGKCIGRYTPGSSLHFGALEKSELTDKAGRYLEECFNRAGCKAVFEENIMWHIWNKAVANISANIISAVTRLPADLFREGDGEWLRVALLREACNVATAAGLDGEKMFNQNAKLVMPPYYKNFFASTAQDMLIYKRKTEVESFSGAVVRLGERFGVPTPHNEMMYHMVKLIQDNYDRQYIK